MPIGTRMCRQVAAGVLWFGGDSAKTKDEELKTKTRLCVQEVEEVLRSYPSMLSVRSSCKVQPLYAAVCKTEFHPKKLKYAKCEYLSFDTFSKKGSQCFKVVIETVSVCSSLCWGVIPLDLAIILVLIVSYFFSNSISISIKQRVSWIIGAMETYSLTFTAYIEWVYRESERGIYRSYFVLRCIH
jgi:hypothetical protein